MAGGSLFTRLGSAYASLMERTLTNVRTPCRKMRFRSKRQHRDTNNLMIVSSSEEEQDRDLLAEDSGERIDTLKTEDFI